LTKKEAAVLRCGVRSVERWISSGRLRACKLGSKRVRIRRSDIGRSSQRQRRERL
jgi:excisionase family DNA binding protein